MVNKVKGSGGIQNASGYLIPCNERGPGDPTEFDALAAQRGLASALPSVLAADPELKSWAQRWYRMKYVPEEVLNALHLTYPEQ